MEIKSRKLLIYTAAGWSGFFVMGVELLGGRLLAPYFGSSIFVWGGIISVFMTCLSIGYLIGGQLSLYKPSMSLFGLLLIGEAVLVLPIIGAGDVILEYLSYLVPDSRYGALLGSLLLFGAPSLMSGMISPYAVRLLVCDLQKSGHSAGVLYFVSTLGSAAGTILTSFYFVLYLEINAIIMSLICVSGVVGTTLFITDQTERRRNACTCETC